MPDLLTNIGRVSQPPSGGYDNNSIKNNPIIPSDTKIQNVVDPSRIVRSDAKTEMEDARYNYSTESNYGNFIQNLQGMPKLAELLSKIMLLDAQTIITSGLGEDYAQQIAQYMEMMRMDPEQLISYVKEQAADSGKYGGVFFQTLRDILNGTGSLELRTGILDFLKQYGDMASSDHLLNNILAEMDQIIPLMYKEDSDQLVALREQLRQPEENLNNQEKQSLLESINGRVEHNARLLKEDIIPLFSKYIMRTKDLGKIRDIMTLFTLNTSRYVNGTKENVLQSFQRLFQFTDFRQRLGDIKEENLELILNKMLMEQNKGEHRALTEELLDIIRTGLKGEGGYEAKQIFNNVLNAMLLNESVYMPLIHLMLPINLNDNIMFSEMWVDPDAGNSGGGGDSAEREIRFLVKFDIQNLGFFDVVINYRGGKVDMLVNYPPRLHPVEKEIRNEIGKIVTNNGLNFHSLELGESRTPISIMEVFPKIVEGRNAVNVRV